VQEGGPSKEAASLSKTTLVTRGALSHLTVENGRLHSVESRGHPFGINEP